MDKILFILADVDAVSLEDVEFVLKFVYGRVEYSSKFPHQKHLPEQIFRGESSNILR